MARIPCFVNTIHSRRTSSSAASLLQLLTIAFYSAYCCFASLSLISIDRTPGVGASVRQLTVALNGLVAASTCTLQCIRVEPARHAQITGRWVRSGKSYCNSLETIYCNTGPSRQFKSRRERLRAGVGKIDTIVSEIKSILLMV